jgi:hypothetical protein
MNKSNIRQAVWCSIANSVCGSVRNYIGITVWNPIRNSVYISVQHSVEDYFQTNSDIIKQ